MNPAITPGARHAALAPSAKPLATANPTVAGSSTRSGPSAPLRKRAANQAASRVPAQRCWLSRQNRDYARQQRSE